MNSLLAGRIKESLEQTYKNIVLMHHRLWELMLAAQEDLDENEEMSLPLYELQQAVIDGEKVYRGVIYNFLPRERDIEPQSQIKKTWTYTAMRLFGQITDKYDSIYAQFVIYLPAGMWDVDNRPIRYIINGIRRCGLIPDDNYKYFMYSVQGEADSKNPRVEIYIFDGKRKREQLESVKKYFPTVNKT